MLRAIYSYTAGFLSIVFFGLLVLFIGPLQALFLNRWPHHGRFIPIAQRIRRIWADFLLKLFGIRLKVSGAGSRYCPSPSGFVIVSNHQSALDILVFLSLFHSNVAFLAKKELLQIPLFGWGAWLSGTVYIDRRKGRENRASLATVEKTLKNGGSVIIYPEGTRSVGGELLPFKRGAFVTAIAMQAPILPICIKNSWKLLPKKTARFRPGEIEVVIEEPILSAGMGKEDRFRLAEMARERIAKHLDPSPKS